jgi:hypothetical protein
MGHMGMIVVKTILKCRMKKNISCKCSCNIVAILVKVVANVTKVDCKWQLVACSNKCIGYIFKDLL